MRISSFEIEPGYTGAPEDEISLDYDDGKVEVVTLANLATAHKLKPIFVVVFDPIDGAIGGVEWRYSRDEAYEFMNTLADDLDALDDATEFTLWAHLITTDLTEADDVTDYVCDGFLDNDAAVGNLVRLTGRTSGVQYRHGPIEVKTLLANAYSLLGDGNGGEWDDNPEYLRAIIELVSDTLGIDADHREYTSKLIRSSK